MNQKSTRIGLSLVLAASSLAACIGANSKPDDGGSTGGTGGTGATGAMGSGGTSGIGAGGTSGANPAGGAAGTSGANPAGGAAGTSGTNAGGSAGTTPGLGGGGGLSGGSAGAAPTGGVSGDAGSGGIATGGSGAAGTGGGAAGAGAGGAAGGSTGPVTVQLAQTKQKIDGFGINNTWATAMTDADADAMFSTTNGLGLSILRVGMGSNGMPMSSNIPADITKARARNVTYIIGSCWSPPGNCKMGQTTAGSENDGGHVLTSCYESWSTTIANFANTNDLYAMSIGNEPDFASCGRTEPCNGNYPTTLYTANEMVAFLKVAGPKLRAAGVKVIAPEASEWIHNWSNVSATGSEPSNRNSSDPLRCGFPPTNAACNNGGGYDYGHALYRDQTAWGLLDIMGVHQYDTQVAEPWPADIPDRKPVWQTEMSGVKWWPEQGPSATIENGIAVAGWIHSALTIGEASAWLWWWWRAYDTDDNEGLYIKNGTGWTDTKRHYTFMNYSRFIRPNYMRVDVTGSVPADVLLTAFKGADNTVVVVAINKGSTAASLPIAIAGGTAPASLVPWVTSATDNFVAKTAVTVSGGSFTAALAGKTVTTFVGR